MMRLPVLFLVLSLPLAANAQTEVDGVGPVTEGEVDAFVVADVDRDGMLSFPSSANSCARWPAPASLRPG
jgi:hypothetical protein